MCWGAENEISSIIILQNPARKMGSWEDTLIIVGLTDRQIISISYSENNFFTSIIKNKQQLRKLYYVTSVVYKYYSYTKLEIEKYKSIYKIHDIVNGVQTP